MLKWAVSLMWFMFRKYMSLIVNVVCVNEK